MKKPLAGSEGGKTLSIETILAELKRERAQLDRAIAALQGAGSSSRKRRITAKHKRRGGMTAAGRKRLSAMMKKRWAERKKKGK